MQNVRVDLYRSLAGETGKTPLTSYTGEVSNANRIWIKRECDNPFGSHYDRVFLSLFKHYEEAEKIQPGSKVLETTSGTAGVSFAGIGRLLGYECHVAIPAGVDNAVIDAIKKEGAVLYFTPEEDYVSGFPEFLKRFLPRNRDFGFLNHSMGPRRGVGYTNNEITLSALEGIGREVTNEIDVDYFIPAVGNGSSVLGPARVLGDSTTVFAFESVQSAVAYDQKYPGEYERKFEIKPGTLPRHKLRGTSFPGIDFPHIRAAVNEGIIDEVVLVSDVEMDSHYYELTGRKDTEQLPHWDMPLFDHEDLGRTGRAGISVALRIAEDIEDKNMLIIAYDKADRYDS